jgi:Rad3-related DNA helicase
MEIDSSWYEDNQQREAEWQRWLDEDQQRQQQRDDKRQFEVLSGAGQQHLMEQRMEYEEWLAEQRREGFETVPQRGLDRHDFYCIDTAHELEEAMQRAASQGVDYTKADKFQKFLEQEADRGIGQVEGKRSLSDRFQELQKQSREVAGLTERGARPEQIPPVKLYESAQEQQARLAQERELRGQGRSPVRERLAEIRQQHGLEQPERQAERQVQRATQRGRGR